MIEVASDVAAAGIEVGLGWLVAEVVVAPGDAALDRVSAEGVVAAADRLQASRAQDWPAVAATRAAYKALGKDPARYRPAAEALLRRIAQGKGLFRASNVVAVNNLLSLETGFSIGVYDLAALTPPVVFRRGRPGEVYAGIGRGPLNLDGLPVFADASGPFGSPTSDSARSMVGDATVRALMVVIGFAPVVVEPAHLARAGALLEAHGASRAVASGLVSSSSNSAS